MNLNQTQEHDEIKLLAQGWFLEHGFKPVEFEVPVVSGWIADLAGIIVPTATELQNLKLITRFKEPKFDRELWDNKEATIAHGMERGNLYRQWRENAESMMNISTMLCEVKISTADYRKDIITKFNKTPASMNFLAYPKGLIKPENIPTGWFGLERIGEERLKFHVGTLYKKTYEEMFVTVFALSQRLHNKNQYANISKVMKEERHKRSEMQVNYKIDKVISILTDTLTWRRDDVEETMTERLRVYGVKKVSGYNIETLEKIRQILKGHDIC